MVALFGILLGFLCERLGRKYGSSPLVRRMPAFLLYALTPCVLAALYGLRLALGDDPTHFDRGYQIVLIASDVAIVPVALASLVAIHSAYGVFRAGDHARRIEEELLKPKEPDVPYR